VDCRYRATPTYVQHAFPEISKGHIDLPPNRQFADSAALGHTKLESKVRDLGIEVDDAPFIAQQVNL
jgi:hypothetical protein